MRILGFRPTAGPRLVAYFDVEVANDLRIYNMELRRAADGQLRSYAPKVCGKHAASFHPSLATQITRAAEAVLRGLKPHAEPEI
jgi:hypothetical protein